MVVVSIINKTMIMIIIIIITIHFIINLYHHNHNKTVIITMITNINFIIVIFFHLYLGILCGISRKSSASCLIGNPACIASLPFSRPIWTSNLLLRLSVGCEFVVTDSERESEGPEDDDEDDDDDEDEEEEEEVEEEGQSDRRIFVSSNKEQSCIKDGTEDPRSRCPDRDKGMRSKFPESHLSGTTHASMPLRMFCRRRSKIERLCPSCIFQSMKSNKSKYIHR